MSVKDLCCNINIMNLTNGKIKVIKDFYDLPTSLGQDLLSYYILQTMLETDSIKIFKSYDNDI